MSEIHALEYRFVGYNAAETPPANEPTCAASRTVGRSADLHSAAGLPATKATPSTPQTACEPSRVQNRIAQVRAQQGISQRTMARRLRIDLKSYQALERPETDLRLSQLVALQAAMEVPLVDLLEDTQTLSRPVAERAKMIKVMKTAAALRETPSNVRVERMVQSLCEQLIELMPELAEVSSWPQYGSRRGSSAVGRALAQQISIADLRLPE